MSKYVLGVDPGEEYCGIVCLGDDGHVWWSETEAPDVCCDRVERMMGSLDKPEAIIVEEYKLRPGIARYKAGSTLRTIEVIGVIKFLGRKFKVPVHMVDPSHPVRFFGTPGKRIPDLPRHELSAWKVARWWELFKRGQAK